MGKIPINTEVASSVATELNASCTLIEENVSGRVRESFKYLIDLGLVTVSPDKIEGLTESIVKTEKAIVANISSHIAEVIEEEEKMRSKYKNGISGGGRYSDNGSGTVDSNDGLDQRIDEIIKGKVIKPDDLPIILDSFDEQTIKKLLELININNNDKTNYIDLFLDTKNSEELFTLLIKSFKTDFDFVDFTIDDIKQVQKKMLSVLLESNYDLKEYENNSIIVAKEYLLSVSKDKKIEVGDLLLDEKYRNVLKESLSNLYNSSDSNLSREAQGFRKYVDAIADSNNTTSESIINNNIELLL